MAVEGKGCGRVVVEMENWLEIWIR